MFDLANICIILYEPQDIANIGGVVRVMMNFGLSHLRLVRPVPYEATQLEHFAHRSAALVAGVRHYDTLLSAIADAALVIGTTGRLRQGYLPPRFPRDLAPDLLAEARSGRVAILFGREDFGLPDETLSYCHRLLTIPSDPAYPSLNLTQAVALLAYELWLARSSQGDGATEFLAESVTGESAIDFSTNRLPVAGLEASVQLWFNTLQAVGFITAGSEEVIRKRLRQLLLRAGPDEKELRLVRALAYLVLRSTRRRS
ncbi:MAG: RNA methyltransferase [Chloroflexi bacterium]|nr:RNA methyltransferase [Chloroflexota bacterium]